MSKQAEISQNGYISQSQYLTFFYNSGNDKYIFKFVAGVTQDALDTDF